MTPEPMLCAPGAAASGPTNPLGMGADALPGPCPFAVHNCPCIEGKDGGWAAAHTPPKPRASSEEAKSLIGAFVKAGGGGKPPSKPGALNAAPSGWATVAQPPMTGGKPGELLRGGGSALPPDHLVAFHDCTPEACSPDMVERRPREPDPGGGGMPPAVGSASDRGECSPLFR